MFNWRMLLATGRARYADVMERTLYNGFLSGVSLSGDRYFYPNALLSRTGEERQPWFGCACCPPNVARLLAGLGHYVASLDAEGVWLHLYDACDIATPFGELRIETGYPWDGLVEVEVGGGGLWSLRLRVPQWCEDVHLLINGEPIESDLRSGHYAEVRRDWSPGDRVELRFAMPVRLTEAHPRVDETRGCAAIERGPLVYCVEQAGANALIDVLDVVVHRDASFNAVRRPDLLGGVATIEFLAALIDRHEWSGRLYRTLRVESGPARRVHVQAIPYALRANRGPAPMRVWLPWRDA
jgi:DUF1680 family protein